MGNQDLKARILAHEDAAPRYTSYPPAPQFRPAFPPARLESWLRALTPGQTLSLYLHIPFCARLCYYCGCHTSIANHYERVSDYLALLAHEIALAAAFVPQGVHVSHVHFGGGSPSMLESADFASLMQTLRAHFTFKPGCAIALEADPRHLGADKIAHYAACGVNRLSLGVQDFDDRVLEAVNRPQPYALSRDAVAHARQAGVTEINIDLIYGLPFQTLESQRRTIEQAIALNPSRIAFFGYAHVPWMKKHMSVLDMEALPASSLRYDLFEQGRALLAQAGYRAIGIDHFVRENDPMYTAWREGRLRRNFQGYTVDDADMLLGLGVSAISAAPGGYAQNTTDQRAYADAVQAGMLPVHRGIEKSAEDTARADIIERLMCDFTVNLDEVTARHNLFPGFFAGDAATLAPLAADGLVACEGASVRVNPQAPHIARLAARAFDAYAGQARHSRTV